MYKGKYQTGTDRSDRKLVSDLPLKKTAAPVAVKSVKESETPAKTPKKRVKKQKKGVKAGTVIFYVLYFAMIAGFFLAMRPVLGALEDWLVQYEASQPNVKCQEVFDDLFRDPDWGEIYDLAGLSGTRYETKDSFVSYMKNLVGESELTYSETSAGLSGDHKYIVKLGDEKLAVYTLHAEEVSQTEIADWQLGTVEVFLSYNEDVTIITSPDTTVSINGVTLSDEHIVSTTQSEAEEYLPTGVHGFRSRTMYVDGLLVPPTVTVTDIIGSTVELTYDPGTKTYTQALSMDTTTIGEEETNAVVDAAKVYGRFMIEATDSTNLARYFDSNSETYKAMTKIKLWMQDYRKYSFSEPTVSGYYRYSDDLFSARVTMTLSVTRNNGTVKDYDIDSTFFLEKNDKDKWMVINMTNVDVQAVTTLVRLQYTVDGEVIEDVMVDAAASQLTPPAVTAPEGKTFAGWYRSETDEKGNTTYSLVFTPDEYGLVYLNSDNVLQPMTLHALFE